MCTKELPLKGKPANQLVHISAHFADQPGVLFVTNTLVALLNKIFMYLVVFF